MGTLLIFSVYSAGELFWYQQVCEVADGVPSFPHYHLPQLPAATHLSEDCQGWGL